MEIMEQASTNMLSSGRGRAATRGQPGSAQACRAGRRDRGILLKLSVMITLRKNIELRRPGESLTKVIKSGHSRDLSFRFILRKTPSLRLGREMHRGTGDSLTDMALPRSEWRGLS